MDIQITQDCGSFKVLLPLNLEAFAEENGEDISTLNIQDYFEHIGEEALLNDNDNLSNIKFVGYSYQPFNGLVLEYDAEVVEEVSIGKELDYEDLIDEEDKVNYIEYVLASCLEGRQEYRSLTEVSLVQPYNLSATRHKVVIR